MPGARFVCAGIVTLLALGAFAAGGGVAAAQPEPHENARSVDVRVWQDVNDARAISISARSSGGSWATLGTIPLPLDDGHSSSGRFRYGDISVTVQSPGAEVDGVEVRVWQDINDALSIFVSARPGGGAWATLGTLPLPLDDGHSSSGRFRYGDITIRIEDPAYELPLIEFFGDYSPEERQELRGQVDAVVAYFARRFGFGIPGLTVRFGDDSIDACGHYAHPAVVLKSYCSGALAHEYAHAVQEYLSPSGHIPAWIVEGVANRWSAQYHDAMGTRTYATHLSETVIPLSRRTSASLASMGTYDGLSYQLAHLAVDRLVSLAGEDSPFDFFARRSQHETWEEPFRAVFGVTPHDFYERFEKYRTEVAPPLPRIKGVVLGSGGAPLAGVTVRIRNVSTERSRTVTTGDDGRFEWTLEDGSFDLLLFSGGCSLKWSSPDSRLDLATENRARLSLEADTVGLVLYVPTALSEQCRWIEGLVTDLGGNPRAGVSVYSLTSALGSDGKFVNPVPRDVTGSDGLFAIRVPKGHHRLSVRAGSAVGYYARERGFTDYRPNATLVAAGDSDVRGITIRFGIVDVLILGLDGEQSLRIGLREGNSTQFRAAMPETQFLAPEGTFWIGVYCSDFRVVGWYDRTNGLVSDRSQATLIVMDDSDISLTLALPASVTCR